MQLVRAEEVVIAITGGEIVESHLEALRPSRDRLCLVFPSAHPIGRRRSIQMKDILDLPLVLIDPAKCVRAVVGAACLALGRQRSWPARRLG
jgi:DNA-binding transcriptional LysR family regulator